jgi:3-oxoacyl-[acyl-carrier-protein] synthase II
LRNGPGNDAHDRSELLNICDVRITFLLYTFRMAGEVFVRKPSDRRVRRVAITGLGVIAHCGHNAKSFWDGLFFSDPGDLSPRRIDGFDPAYLFANPKDMRRTDRFTHLALAAADEALRDAGDLSAYDPSRVGTIIGTGIGGGQSLEANIRICAERGPRRVNPMLVPMMMSNAAAANVAIRYGFEGPCETVVTACASGTHAIANAARIIQLGVCDAVVAGASEQPETETSVAAFQNLGAMSPSGFSRPFDLRRDGFVMAEAAGLLVLEEWDAAMSRGARIYAEFLGSASTTDAYHLTAPSPDGIGAQRCMELALRDSGISADDVGYINAHGTGTPLNDPAESRAIERLFGSPGPLVTSTKGVTGHALGAAGAIEAVALTLSIHHGLIPPTRGTDAATVDPDVKVRLVLNEPTEWTQGVALSNSFAFGGHNGTIVMGPA